MRNALVALAALGSAGCLMPRSMAIGQMASLPAAGGVEAGVTGGLGYGTDNAPPQTNGGVTINSSTTNLALPLGEANLQYGITDAIAFNVHGSTAGVQPGVKIAVMKGGGLDVAVLPELGYGRISMSNTSSATINNATQSEVNDTVESTLLVGAKVLFSAPSGVYGGLGYDYSSATFTQGKQGETPDETDTVSQNLTLGAGYNIAWGAVSIRPELDLLYAPSVTTTDKTKDGTTTTTGGSGWMIFPNVTFALGGSSK